MRLELLSRVLNEWERDVCNDHQPNMSHSSPLIVLLEDSDVCALRIIAEVCRSLPNCRLVHARTLEEGRALSLNAPVQVFLVDVNLPDGNGFDFLSEMALIHPNAAAIVMTGDLRPGYGVRSEALGVLRLVEKPVNSKKLIELLNDALNAASGSDGSDSAFEASLKNLTPLDVIQMTCLRRSTALLEFVSQERAGRVGVVSGEIVHAQTKTLVGPDALYDIVTWKRGRVTELSEPMPTTPTIQGDWQMLLMNAAYHIDGGA
ncbi:MAG: Acetoacetate metabolism regulatory protein AtoC [Chthoniobacteraceae bacterium]|nr:Acetoacetate metabolism regulatory protein AtoC [Chthoniobacteraceae bacterium]